MKDLLEEICRALCEGTHLALATVVSDSGSTPRASGSTMIVFRDGKISGTIGGGSVEADVIRSALNLFKAPGALLSSYDLTQPGSRDDMDLVCGGKMRVLIELIAASRGNLAMFERMSEEIRMTRPFYWVGKVEENGRTRHIERAVLTAEGKWFGALRPVPKLEEMLGGSAKDGEKTSLVVAGDDHYVVAPVLPPETVFLVGAGHVSQEIAPLAKQVGFHTVVIDDRADFASAERFPAADEVVVCNDFVHVFDERIVTLGSCIVIVTRGHRYDKEVLAQSLRTDAGYIGMIGSANKRKSVYDGLIQEGFEQSSLDQVHCPIGLSIDAETPAEIAVSVVAELIQHRAGRKKHG